MKQHGGQRAEERPTLLAAAPAGRVEQAWLGAQAPPPLERSGGGPGAKPGAGPDCGRLVHAPTLAAPAPALCCAPPGAGGVHCKPCIPAPVGGLCEAQQLGLEPAAGAPAPASAAAAPVPAPSGWVAAVPQPAASLSPPPANPHCTNPPDPSSDPGPGDRVREPDRAHGTVGRKRQVPHATHASRRSFDHPIFPWLTARDCFLDHLTLRHSFDPSLFVHV